MIINKRWLLKLVLRISAVVFCMRLGWGFLVADKLLPLTAMVCDRLGLLGWAALILASALSCGCALLNVFRLRTARPGATALFGIGLGLGVLSLLTFGIGVVGVATKTGLLMMLLLALASGLSYLGEILHGFRDGLRRVRHMSLFSIALWMAIILFFLMNLTRAFEPPMAYDSLEYHLAAPASYLRTGHIHFLQDNVYANFPQNVEMLYYLSMVLTESPDRGTTVGHLLNGALALLAALALGRMLRGIAGRETAHAATAIFYTWPKLTLYSGMEYVEPALIFYGVLALWGVLWSCRRKRTRPGARGWVLLGGIAAGLALGVKYTAALFVVAPLFGWIVVLAVLSRVKWKEIAFRAVFFAAVLMLVFSPWLVRNYVNTRNPVYPLLYKVFGSTNWDPQKDARWTQAHSPKSFSLDTLRSGVWDVMFLPENDPSILLWLFVPLGLLAGRRTRGVVLFLAVHVLALFLLWFFFTQQITRFLDPAVPLVAAISALGLGSLLDSRGVRGIRPLVIVLLLVAPTQWISYLHVGRSFGIALGTQSPEDYFAQQRFVHYSAMKFINDPKNVHGGSKILFIGEAQTFYCRRNCVASTVFDTNLLEEAMRGAQSPDDIYKSLKEHGITHLYVDTVELLRLQESYRYNWQERERLGMLDDFNWPLFGHFAEKYLRPVKTFAGREAASFPWARWNLEYLFPLLLGRQPSQHMLALYEVI